MLLPGQSVSADIGWRSHRHRLTPSVVFFCQARPQAEGMTHTPLDCVCAVLFAGLLLPLQCLTPLLNLCSLCLRQQCRLWQHQHQQRRLLQLVQEALALPARSSSSSIQWQQVAGQLLTMPLHLLGHRAMLPRQQQQHPRPLPLLRMLLLLLLDHRQQCRLP